MSQSGARLTKKERQVLELAIQGVSVDRMAVRLKQSPKVVERFIHHGLYKLEVWSQDVAPGPSHDSPYERDLGFLRPREAERRIALVQAPNDAWGCVVALAIPPEPKSPDSESTVDALSVHIHRNLRRSDIVTKWSTTEWVIFVAPVTADAVEMVVRRLRQANSAPWPVFVAGQLATEGDRFGDLGMRLHREIISQYVSQDLGSYGTSVADSP